MVGADIPERGGFEPACWVRLTMLAFCPSMRQTHEEFALKKPMWLAGLIRLTESPGNSEGEPRRRGVGIVVTHEDRPET